MSTTPPTIFDHLERDWDQLVCRGAADRALARWRDRVGRLSEFEDVHGLIAALADPAGDPVERNELMAALVGQVPGDAIAAQLVLTRLLPLLKSLCRDHEPLSIDEWAGIVLATAYEVVCLHGAAGDASYLVARISRDIRRRALRHLAARRRDHAEIVDEDLDRRPDPDAGSGPYDAIDLDEFLGWVVRRGLVDRRSLGLVWATRIGGETVRSIATATRCRAAALRQRRWRAERRLAAAFAAVVSA